MCSKFRSVSKMPSNHTPSKRLADGLSPMARSIHDKVGNYFKATKANASDSKALNGRSTHHEAKQAHALNEQTPETQTPSLSRKNSQAHRSNSAGIEVAIPSKRQFDGSAYVDPSTVDQASTIVVDTQTLPKLEQPPPQSQQPSMHPSPTPVKTTPDAAKPLFRIELPGANINRDEYQEVEETPEIPHNLSSRKGQRDGFTDSQDLIGESLDQRQRREAALDAFDKLVRSVFTAVGNAFSAEPGSSNGIVIVTPDSQVTLTASIQQKLHGAIQKTINLGCFNQVPVEHLIRITKLSEGMFKQAENLEMRVDESWSEESVQSWIQQLSEVETTLKAARTCLRMLSGGREDRQLYSESVIQHSVDVFKMVTEDIITPLVELRGSGSSADVFKMILKQKKAVTPVFISCQKLFAVLAELVSKIELSDAVITTLEFVATRLIFVENAYFEKDSAIGVQRFDGIRSVSMDMLCQIFLIKPQQRQGIIDEILTSLEKLPVGKQSARQFKLSDGGNIQPVSALIMRLVQASSGKVDQSKERNRSAMIRGLDGEDDDEEQDDRSRNNTSSIKSEEQGARQHAVSIKDLETVVAPLTETMRNNASIVINFIVHRAMGSTKSGDTPYRILFDLFVEDFTTCLDSSDWPSAELLLELLVQWMMTLFEGPKTAAPTKNMALEILGGLCAAISRLRSYVKRVASSFEGSDSDELSRCLADLATFVLEHKGRMEQTIAWAGPYRVTLEYLQSRCADDPHLSSVMSFLIADWATQVHNVYDSFQDDDSERDQELGRLAFRLRMMIEDRRWLVNEYTFKAVSPSQAKLAYSIILLRSLLCESFGKILGHLLNATGSDQATVRSKSLKSVNQVLETDPSILDGESQVIQRIVDCAHDSSTQVRDSALGLLGNCMIMRPALENSLIKDILARFQDAGVGVRKRAMKLTRDIYLRNHNKEIRSLIANGLLRRVQDPDEGVQDLARQMIEEVWFAPFYSNEGTATYQTSLSEHVALIIQTVKTGTLAEILDKVFQSILRPHNKSLSGPFSVCSKIVAHMFTLIDNVESDDATVPSGQDALNVLTIFANADPTLFTFEQVRLLKPNLASIAGEGSLAAFVCVTIIYRHVLPQLSAVHSDFLQEVRMLIMPKMGKLPTNALEDLILCVTVISQLLNSFGNLANVVSSSLLGLSKIKAQNTPDDKMLRMANHYCRLVGLILKHCDLQPELKVFRERFPKWKNDDIPKLAIGTFLPFTVSSKPLELRRASLEAVGLVCQSSPRNFVLAQVYTTFQQIFSEQVPVLELMILRSIRDFFQTEEKRSEKAPATDKKKELTVMGGSSFDDVATATTQRFLEDFNRISLTSQDEHAFTAVEVLASINRQGLTHPKNTGVTLITLETSANKKIAELAFSEHRVLHEKHETVVEREYAKAVQSAFSYQRDIVKDSHGATLEPFQSKLHFLMEVLKISKMKNRQRFLEKMCNLMDFDLTKLDAAPELPPHVEFTRFIVENLAFFEYQTVGELQTTVNLIEKMVASLGTVVAQAIEAEVFNVRMDVDQPSEVAVPVVVADGMLASEQPVEPKISVDPDRLRQLAAASIVLLLMWEVRTHLRRLFGMGTSRHDSKAKALSKDLNKTPVRVQGVHGERVWQEMQSHMNGLDDQQRMVQKCTAFVELMNVDKEFQVVDDEDQAGFEGPSTPSEGEDDDGMADRGHKRKGSSTPGGRKKRARADGQPRKRGRPRKHSVEHDADADHDGDWI